MLHAHEVLHPQRAEIRELLNSGVAEHRVLALYPLDFAAYAPTLSAAYVNPGAMKVALRLNNTHKVMLSNSHAMGKRIIPGADQAWQELRLSETHRALMHAITPLGEGPTSQQISLRTGAHIMLMNLHNLLWHMQTWPGTCLPADTLSGATEHVFETSLAKLEAKYLRPMLVNIEGALAARR